MKLINVRIFTLTVLFTLMGIMFFSPVKGGPCNAGLDLIVAMFGLVITAVPALISTIMIQKNKSNLKVVVIILSSVSVFIWTFLVVNILPESIILGAFMIPTLLLYIVILMTGFRSVQ